MHHVLAGQIHQDNVGVISQSIEHNPLAVGRNVEVLNHRAALQVEAGELTLLASLEIQTEKVLIRSRALKSDQRLSAWHEAIRCSERQGQTRTQRRHRGHNNWSAIRTHRLDVEASACGLLGIDNEPIIGGPHWIE